jgi:hypothetical protein
MLQRIRLAAHRPVVTLAKEPRQPSSQRQDGPELSLSGQGEDRPQTDAQLVRLAVTSGLTDL